MMKAVLMTNAGGVDVLKLQEVDSPALTNPKQILVKLQAAGVNPIDTKLRARGTGYPDRLPTILGCDGCGVVTEIGQEVAPLKPGDTVYFCYGGIGIWPGNYAEYAVVDARFAAAIPRNLSPAQAGALPLIAITAWESLHDRARITHGQTVLIHGGAGGVGHIAIQLAKAAGAKVIATVRSEEEASFASQLGADEVMINAQEGFIKSTLALTGGDGVDIALDTLGGETFSQTCQVVRYGGDLVTLLQPPEQADWKSARQRNLRVSFELMLTPMQQNILSGLTHHAEILKKVADHVEQGQIKLPRVETFPLADAAKAHQKLESGNMVGKICLIP